MELLCPVTKGLLLFVRPFSQDRNADRLEAALLFQPRQFPRVSLTTEVKIQFGSEVFTATTEEIGAGGMALQNASHLSVAQPVQVSFTLPEGPKLTLEGVVWWKRDHRVGIRFDPRDGNCRLVGQWVEQQKKHI